MSILEHPTTITGTPVRMLELELTAKCPLACTHCLTDSSPRAGHGTMTVQDWVGAIDQATALGIPKVQFIGGEPLTHPAFEQLLTHALDAGHRVEVFSNLHTVSRQLWGLFEHPAVSLATSYYSLDPVAHDAVTTVAGSHARNRANLIEALRRGIAVRVGIIEVVDGQRIDDTRAELVALGVPADRIGVDRMRVVGRPARGQAPQLGELCGRCGDGKAAILPDGTVAPCVLGRFLATGNVRAASLASILGGPTWREAMAVVPRVAGADPCKPDSDGGDCSPAETPACAPAYN
ncbi:MAG: radical SAM protein [Sciscionella sp.]